jgi:hypothetical protein
LLPNWSSKPSSVVSALGRGHDAGVVDQDVVWVALSDEALADRGDAGERREVEVFEPELGPRDLLAQLPDGGRVEEVVEGSAEPGTVH